MVLGILIKGIILTAENLKTGLPIYFYGYFQFGNN